MSFTDDREERDHDDPLTMTRHALMVRALLAGAGVAALSSPNAVAAYARSSIATSPRATPTPKRGGTLNLAVAPGFRGFDPQKFWDGFVWTATLAIADPLLWVGDDLKLRPNLASLPKVNKRGTLYTFKLRRGVKFHNGREMTADDVKFSLERIVTPKFACEGASLYTGLPIAGLKDVVNDKANTIRGIKVIDKYTFSITLNRPDSALPYLLSLPFASVVPRDVVQQLGDDQFNLKAVGTGAFRLAQADLDKGFTLVRNPSYWKPGIPYLNQVVGTKGFARDLAALKIQRGELDLMQQRPPVDLVVQARDSKSTDAQLVIAPYNLWYYFTLNTRQFAPFGDVRVRQAVAYALDRDRLLRSLRGLGVVANGGLFSAQTPYYQKGLHYPYDPNKARQLLQAAGKTGFEVEIMGGSGSPDRPMVENAGFDLEQIGLKPKLTITTGGEFTARAYDGNPPPMTAYVWDLPYPHGSYFIDGAFTSAAIDAKCCDLSMYSSPTVESLVVKGHRSPNEAEITKIYKQIDKKVVRDDVAAIPMIQDVRIELMSKRVRGFKVQKTFTTPHFLNDYWLAS
jgi:peptide/nickel transport system substrate-binding protein/oligopeptide transport system substrate-binding protein